MRHYPNYAYAMFVVVAALYVTNNVSVILAGFEDAPTADVQNTFGEKSHSGWWTVSCKDLSGGLVYEADLGLWGYTKTIANGTKTQVSYQEAQCQIDADGNLCQNNANYGINVGIALAAGFAIGMIAVIEFIIYLCTKNGDSCNCLDARHLLSSAVAGAPPLLFGVGYWWWFGKANKFKLSGAYPCNASGLSDERGYNLTFLLVSSVLLMAAGIVFGCILCQYDREQAKIFEQRMEARRRDDMETPRRDEYQDEYYPQQEDVHSTPYRTQGAPAYNDRHPEMQMEMA